MNELSDDEVMQAPREMSDDEVMAPPQSAAPTPPTVPEPFLDRVRAGQALQRVMDKAAAGAKEGYGDSTPTGLSDETLDQLIDTGIFHDPLKSRPNAIQFVNEAAILPMAKGWDALMRGLNGGLHGAGGAIGQIVEEMGGSQGEAARAENEVINAGNWAMIEGGMGRFARPHVDEAGPRQQVVGTLPQEADFKTGAAVVGNPAVSEPNLRSLWQERGIHPAEAVHDAQTDAFLKQDLRTPETDPAAKLPAEAWSPEELASRPYELKPASIPLDEQMARLDEEMRTSSDYHPGASIDDKYSKAIEVATSPAQPQLKNASDVQWAVDNGRLDIAEAIVARAERNAREAVGKKPGVDRDINPDRYAKIEAQLKRSAEQEKKNAEELRAIIGDRGGTESEGKPASLGAAAAGETPTLAQQPPPAPGRLSAAIKDGADRLFDIGRDLQMMTAPMATGSRESMAIAKDFANSMRRNRWEWSRIDENTAKRFTPEQRKRMWDAADEESVARQLGESREHQGLVTLEPEERAAVEQMHARAQNAWLRAVDMGMVEGDGLPAYTPRMIINAASATGKDAAIPLNGIGGNLRTRTAQMMRRQHMTAEETEAAAKAALGDTAEIARDIRALPLATAKLEDAIAGRTLIDSIKEYGKRTGEETLSEGGKPAGSEHQWFTIDHPAFRTWKPKFEEVDGKVQAATDKDGNVIFQQVPIFVRGDFEGPLRAVLTQKSGALYGAAMSLKGKTMSLIMNSPLIHNAVEWGRAMPAMPGKVATFKIYFEGNRAKNNVPLMREAIDAGLVPIGHRFFNQDISSIMEEPNLAPGRSWTAKVLGAVPGLLDEAAGNAVKSAIDKAGNFWHNTMLWDRVGDLQMGLYVNLKSSLTAKGIDNQSAARVAAHFANRYAGALPQEAMSDGARKISNMLLFSRSFTLGNLGVMKDMLTGLPKDVMAQIERDAGFRAGSIELAGEGPAADIAASAKTMARRKAMAVVALDIGMMYVGNSLLQNVMNVMLGDSTLDKEAHGYAERLNAMLSEIKEHPLKLLQPLALAESLSATTANEPGKADRVMIGTAKDGTAIYARNPVGKIGEEFTGYMTGPLDMLRRKLGTLARPAWQIASNDKGFGRKVYDPNADTPAKYLANLGKIAAHIMGSQLPEGQIGAFSDLVKGEGDAKVNALQAFGPIAGVTFSKGAPGGPAVGEMYAARSQHEFAVQAAMPDIRKQIQRGDLQGARERMNELKIPPGLQNFYVRTTINPATRLSPTALKNFYNTATPEQIRRMQALPVR